VTGVDAPLPVGRKGLLVASLAGAILLFPLHARAGLDLESLFKQGEYEKVLAEAKKRPGSGAQAIARVIRAARAEMALGRFDEARRRLEIAATRAPNHLPLRAALLPVADALGDRAQLASLLAQFAADWPDGRQQRASVAELVAMGTALRFANDFNRANELFRQATIKAGRAAEPQIAWGWLLLEKHALVDADRSFSDALLADPRNPDALIGSARIAIDRNYDREQAILLIARALKENPRHGPALATRAELELDAGAFDAVRATVSEIVRTNPGSSDAAWLLAALERLVGNETGYGLHRDSALASKPHDARFFAAVAEALVRHRRYEDARVVALHGVSVDARNARCLSVLGTTLLRMGEENEGLGYLRTAFAVDPYDTRTFNQLELFEKTIAQKYIVHATAHFRLRIEKHTRAAIEHVVAPFLEEVYARYSARYAYTPAKPIVVELYGKPEDFAVRTVGLPNLDVEAVCFGRVITAHAPDLANGSWGMILAHELAHVFALGLGKERVPRWFTEGLAEVETTHIHPAWTRREHMVLFGAMHQGRIPPIGDLSRAFIDAQTPEQAIAAYMVSAHAVSFLERRHGFAKLRQALVDFGNGMSGDAVLNRITQTERTLVDAAFTKELTDRYQYLQTQFLPSVTELYPREEADLRAHKPGANAADRARAGLSAMADGDSVSAKRWLALARPKPGVNGAAPEPLVSFLEATIADRDHDPVAIQSALLPLLQAGLEGYDLRTRLGLSSVETGVLVDAERHFVRATELAPEQLEAWVFLARLYERTNRPREQLHAQTQAFLLDPQNARLGKEIVTGALALQRYERVLEIAPLVVFIDPSDTELQTAQGRALRSRGDYPRAVQAYEHALQLGPKNPEGIRAALGELYTLTGFVKPSAGAKGKPGQRPIPSPRGSQP
jgi:cellulose synthase operon protein C